MYKEQAYLNIKTGKIEEAVQILIDYCCDNLKEVVDLAVQFNISDDLLWDKIITKSKGDAKRVITLLQYSDVYKDPKRFIDALDDDTEIDQIYGPLQETFHRLKVQKVVLNSAISSSERAKQQIANQLIAMNSIGFSNIKNKCNFCD